MSDEEAADANTHDSHRVAGECLANILTTLSKIGVPSRALSATGDVRQFEELGRCHQDMLRDLKGEVRAARG